MQEVHTVLNDSISILIYDVLLRKNVSTILMNQSLQILIYSSYYLYVTYLYHMYTYGFFLTSAYCISKFGPIFSPSFQTCHKSSASRPFAKRLRNATGTAKGVQRYKWQPPKRHPPRRRPQASTSGENEPLTF